MAKVVSGDSDRERHALAAKAQASELTYGYEISRAQEKVFKPYQAARDVRLVCCGGGSEPISDANAQSLVETPSTPNIVPQDVVDRQSFASSPTTVQQQEIGLGFRCQVL
jgi:hypothetical protein